MMRGRRREAGNTMLELVLLLPTYVLVLIILIAFGEYGVLQTHSQISGRWGAWREAPPSFGTMSSTFFSHLGSRFNANGKPRKYDQLAWLSGAGRKKQETLPATGSNDAVAVHSWSDTKLTDPLYGAGQALSESFRIQGNFSMPGGRSVWSPQAYTNLKALTVMAVDGDVLQTGGIEAIPWMRRRHASVVVRYDPSSLLGIPFWCHSFHTVVRGRTYSASNHKPYPSTSASGLTLDDDLRDIEAFEGTVRPVAQQTLEGLQRGHQMDALNTPVYLEAALQAAP